MADEFGPDRATVAEFLGEAARLCTDDGDIADAALGALSEALLLTSDSVDSPDSPDSPDAAEADGQDFSGPCARQFLKLAQGICVSPAAQCSRSRAAQLVNDALGGPRRRWIRVARVAGPAVRAVPRMRAALDRFRHAPLDPETLPTQLS